MSRTFDKTKPTMGKTKQERNPALDPNSQYYDKDLAKRRKKERLRRKTNQRIRKRRGA